MTAEFGVVATAALGCAVIAGDSGQGALYFPLAWRDLEGMQAIGTPDDLKGA